MWTRLISRLPNEKYPRAVIAAHGLVIAVAVALSFVPLLNLLGYESAAIFGVVGGVLALVLTVFAVTSGAVEAPLSEERNRGPSGDFGRLALIHLSLLVGPLLVLSLNGFRVPNCDWVAGFLFWGLIPLFAVLVGQACGWVAATALAGKPRRIWVLALAIPLLDTAVLLGHLALGPSIVGHHMWMGYFGGSIYDEALGVPMSLVVLRGIHALAVVVIVAGLEATFRIRRGQHFGWQVALTVGAAILLVVSFAHRQEAGLYIDRGYVQAQLGGEVETEHFVIYYPEAMGYGGNLEGLIEDHEFRYHQMREFFGTDPVAERGEKLKSFVYPNRDAKGRLMGGRDTMVAKIWLGEMHILWSGTGDRMLAHELAHLFTAPFGRGPLKLSMQGLVGVNMGLVEGIASAAEWSAEDFPPHEASAAMRRLGIGPDLRTILGVGGFWTEASGPAYTAMGSFVRYLVDHWGMDTFQVAYGDGDFHGAYGRPVEELIAEWEEFLDRIELTERQEEVARFRFDRPSIFGKVCARALAERRLTARRASRAGLLSRAASAYEHVLADDPQDVAVRLEYGRLLRRMERGEEALSIALEPPEGISLVQRAQFLELAGDLHWQAGSEVEARRVYQEALGLGVPVAQERNLVMKSRLVGDDGGGAARELLVDGVDGVRAMYLLTRWRREEPHRSEAAYLLGRRLWAGRHYEEAREHLEDAAGAMGVEVLDAEAWLMLGHSYYEAGEPTLAREIFEDLALSEITRYREAARLWLKRLDWSESLEDGEE